MTGGGATEFTDAAEEAHHSVSFSAISFSVIRKPHDSWSYSDIEARAMGNGSPATKAAADWIAPPVAEDGAAVAVERFVLDEGRRL